MEAKFEWLWGVNRRWRNKDSVESLFWYTKIWRSNRVVEYRGVYGQIGKNIRPIGFIFILNIYLC